MPTPVAPFAGVGVTASGGGGAETVNVQLSPVANGFPSAARIAVVRVARYCTPCASGALGSSSAVFVASLYLTLASTAPPASVPVEVPTGRTLNDVALIVVGSIGRENVVVSGTFASTLFALTPGAVAVTVGAAGSPSGTTSTSAK